MKRVMMVLALVGVAACGSSQRQAISPPAPTVALDVTTEATSTTTAPPPTTTTATTTLPPTTLPAPQPTARISTPTTARSVEAAPAMGGFQACVARRESGNNPHIGGGLYGILDSTWHSLGYSGHARDASVATQTAAFNTLYGRFGAAPWRPYDGC